MQGYWRDDEATSEALRDGWLHTGDLGFLSEHGLVVCGRKKDMIILGGRNLYPEDYEFFTEQVPGVRAATSSRSRSPSSSGWSSSPRRRRWAPKPTASRAPRSSSSGASLPRGPEEVVLVVAGDAPEDVVRQAPAWRVP